MKAASIVWRHADMRLNVNGQWMEAGIFTRQPADVRREKLPLYKAILKQLLERA